MGGNLGSVMSDRLSPTPITIDAFKEIIEAVDAPIIVADRGGRLLAANGTAKTIVGTNEPLVSTDVNVFESLFHTDGLEILNELAAGRAWAERETECRMAGDTD
jgi:PAS domain-containing protein